MIPSLYANIVMCLYKCKYTAPIALHDISFVKSKIIVYNPSYYE